jgi:hypothetical protein
VVSLPAASRVERSNRWKKVFQTLETRYPVAKEWRIFMSEKLKHGLKELKDELEQINSENPKLQKLAGDVDTALAQPGDVSRALVHSMQHAAEEFEVHHPQMTAIINNIMNSLSGLGI